MGGLLTLLNILKTFWQMLDEIQVLDFNFTFQDMFLGMFSINVGLWALRSILGLGNGTSSSDVVAGQHFIKNISDRNAADAEKRSVRTISRKWGL